MKYIAYIDGSFKDVPGIGKIYGSAYIFAQEGDNNWVTAYKACSDEYSKFHNVAGEVFACMMLCERVIQTGDCEILVIHYDYEGIEKWVRRTWAAKSELAKQYVAYMYQRVLPNIKLQFIHTKGHSGVEGNEIVDRLAKESIDNYVLRKLGENKNG